MDWSTRDVICFATRNPVAGVTDSSTGSKGHGVTLVCPAHPWDAVAVRGHAETVVAARWSETGDDLLTVDAGGV